MIIVYHGSSVYMPVLACINHLGSTSGAEGFFQAVLSRNWRQEPFYIAGMDGEGNQVGCLIYGRYSGVFQRALSDVGELFAVPVRWVDTRPIYERQNWQSKLLLLLLQNFPNNFAWEYHCRFADSLRQLAEDQP